MRGAFLSAIPLLAIPLVLANLVAYAADTRFEAVWFIVPLPSGGALSMTAGWTITVISLVLLYVEIFKATRTGRVSIVDHVLSLAVFIVALIEFIIVPGFAHAAFLALIVMMLIDVIAGFTVTITAARRDFGTPVG